MDTYLLGMIGDPDRKSSDDHISIPDGLNFIHIISVDCGIKASVKIIEQVHDLKRSRMSGNRSKSNDVREINGDFFELLRIDGHPKLQLIGNRTKNCLLIKQIKLNSFRMYLPR